MAYFIGTVLAFFSGFMVGRIIGNDYRDFILRRNAELEAEIRRLHEESPPDPADWWKA